MYFDVWETMVYILIHIQRGGVIKNSTKPAPKIPMFMAGAVSALLISLGPHQYQWIQPASTVSVWLALGDFFQASGGVLLVYMVDQRYHGINYYPTPSPLPQFLPNDWAERVSKSSGLLTLWIDDPEACALYCFPEICHEIKFQSSVVIAGFIYHSFLQYSLSCLTLPLFFFFYQYFLLAFLFSLEPWYLGLLLGNTKPDI